MHRLPANTNLGTMVGLLVTVLGVPSKTSDNKSLHPSREVGRFELVNRSSRPGELNRYAANGKQ